MDIAKEMQVAIAQRMKEDMKQVRDEWSQILSEKDLEMKKAETADALRLRTIKSEMTMLHQAQIKDIQDFHSEQLVDLKAAVTQYEARMQKMIDIVDHEQIMNTELQKANQAAQEKLEQIKADMESEMTASLEERTKALEEDYTR